DRGGRGPGIPVRAEGVRRGQAGRLREDPFRAAPTQDEAQGRSQVMRTCDELPKWHPPKENQIRPCLPPTWDPRVFFEVSRYLATKLRARTVSRAGETLGHARSAVLGTFEPAATSKNTRDGAYVGRRLPPIGDRPGSASCAQRAGHRPGEQGAA